LKCYKHDVEMKPAIVDYAYRGVVVKGVQALRCPECGEEVIGVEEYAQIKKRIEGIIKPLKLRRKVSAAGKRPAIYLPEDVVKAAHIKIGDEVDIYMEDDKIIISPIANER
jgi:YgiT-type zinc finger domain-containing protein